MTATLSFAADAYRAGTRHAPHRHDDLHLSLVLSGRVAETVGGVTEYASALSVVAKDAGRMRREREEGRGKKGEGTTTDASLSSLLPSSFSPLLPSHDGAPTTRPRARFHGFKSRHSTGCIVHEAHSRVSPRME